MNKFEKLDEVKTLLAKTLSNLETRIFVENIRVDEKIKIVDNFQKVGLILK